MCVCVCVCVCVVGYRFGRLGPLLPSLGLLPLQGCGRASGSRGLAAPAGGVQLVGRRPPLPSSWLFAAPVPSALSPRSSPKPTPRLAPSHILLPRQGHAAGLEWVRSPSHVAPLPALGQSGGSGWRGFQSSPRRDLAVGRGALGAGAGPTRKATAVRRGTRAPGKRNTSVLPGMEKQTLVRRNPGRT